MIEVKNLTKRYGNHLALNNITFKVKKGEILGLLGPNGAGKTTTMRILTGFIPPTEGTVEVAGFNILTESMSVREKVGYMPERIPIYPDMTVEGYVKFWANIRKTPKAKQRVAEVLERVQLDHRRKSLVRSLSKGMRQRLGLAQALVHDPEIIILDEPTIGIDPQQVIEVRESVHDLARDHTVLFSTHILSEAEQVCDRVIILNEGAIVAEGKPETLRQKLQGTGSYVYVEVKGAESAQIEKMLRSITGIKNVERQVSGYALQGKQNIDIRPHIFKQVNQAGYTLLEMRPVAITLEDIFLDIIEKDKPN